MEFRSGKCSVCGKPLGEHDDVVVCPECGAPYHRECYEKEGACVFRARHGTGFSYEAPRAKKTARCANCGADNGEEALFCINCGMPLRAPAEPVTPPYGDPLGGARMGVPPVPAAFDGIPSADWAQYIGNSAQYYLMQFQRMDALHRRTSFCWSALFVPPAYFLYRRMWGWGLLAAALTVILSLPGMLLIAADAGAVLPVSVQLLETLSMICFYLNWALSFACALYAFWLFRRHAAKRLSRLREEAFDESAYRESLARASGPSVLAVLLFLAALMAFTLLFFRWMGLDLMQVEQMLSPFAV